MLSSFGFEIPQMDGDEADDVLQCMVKICRKIEEIEGVKFIEMRDDIKYDDDFRHNPENLICEFYSSKHTIGTDVKEQYAMDSSECISGQNMPCKCVEQMIRSLSYFSQYSNPIQHSKLVQYFREEHTTLLDDLTHIMAKHQTHMKQWIDPCKPKDGKICLSLQRYQSETNHITKCNLNNDSDEAEFDLYLDVMDAIHCSFYHPCDIKKTNADKYTLPKLDIDDSGALMHMKQ
eukprot:194458_1